MSLSPYIYKTIFVYKKMNETQRSIYTNTQPFLPDAFIFIFSIFQFIINHLAINFWKYGCTAINITTVYTYEKSLACNKSTERATNKICCHYYATCWLGYTHISVCVHSTLFLFLNTTTTTFYG